jgi:hypothetical protein
MADRDSVMWQLYRHKWEGVNRVRLVQDTDQWQSLVNTAMNL